ncbi:Hypothetical protein LUCI_2914 [Lucifera butyrica]|uniref:PurM-like N-terminal domain-containing protein n=1 Tax=Lucifera butyrica TaxID=1351585 RepID=A0A498R8Y9_9FIRM|nr:AIR synthase related protein [Lucifera butyrica]VBB07649.1 Hypothetical protein LUCI_2914 [Lucifera butyrica]
MRIKKIRDLTFIDLDRKRTIVIACDSCGSIGLKEHDVLKVPPFITGQYTARVAILEVLCAGAKVIGLTNTICNEMEPTGREIIRGIKAELKDAGIDSVALTGSTEENFPSFSTGLGITAIGIADKAKLKVNSVKDAALVLALGRPMLGQEIVDSPKTSMVDYPLIQELLKQEEIYELVPVGSKGILYEVYQLAWNNSLKLILNDAVDVDIHRSAGPSTVVLAAVKPDAWPMINFAGNMEVIGRLSK